MKTKGKGKSLFRRALWAIATLGAVQIYLVRELFFAWLMFVFAFCLITVGFFLLIMLFEATRAALDWVAPRIPAARPTRSAWLARGH